MTRREQQFVNTVWRYYEEQGRHDLPWRQTTSPYRIVVSELMLQQTQVARVLPKYQAFVKAFPNTKRLAEASLRDVLRLWQGLGYNRRAKLLHQAAATVHSQQGGRWPQTQAGLCALPGIGPYTAGAIMAFAYNQPVPIIETNIRTVYLHHFWPSQSAVTDAEILQQVTRTLPTDCSRDWYWALMDYGAHLKKVVANRNHQSKHYHKQTVFKGSVREVRGAIIRLLSQQTAVSEDDMQTELARYQVDLVQKALHDLCAEQLLLFDRKTKTYQLPT